jgi:hypothetical protein
MNDTPMIIGWSGTLATVSLGQWNEIIAVVCGVVTTVYMATNPNIKKERLERWQNLNRARNVQGRKKLCALSFVLV